MTTGLNIRISIGAGILRFVFGGAVGGGIVSVVEEEELEFCASTDRYASGISGIRKQNNVKIDFAGSQGVKSKCYKCCK